MKKNNLFINQKIQLLKITHQNKKTFKKRIKTMLPIKILTILTVNIKKNLNFCLLFLYTVFLKIKKTKKPQKWEIILC